MSWRCDLSCNPDPARRLGSLFLILTSRLPGLGFGRPDDELRPRLEARTALSPSSAGGIH
jgi:hypothetical protein